MHRAERCDVLAFDVTSTQADVNTFRGCMRSVLFQNVFYEKLCSRTLFFLLVKTEKGSVCVPDSLFLICPGDFPSSGVGAWSVMGGATSFGDLPAV